MDRAARELDIDPLELRRINFIKKGNFPYQSSTGEIIDVGDFDRVLSVAEISLISKALKGGKKRVRRREG